MIPPSALLAVSLAGAAPASAADHVRSELSLASYTFKITYDASLSADDPQHRPFVTPGGASGRVRVGQFETDAALKMGEVALGQPSAKITSFDVWLEAVAGGWQLVFAETTNPLKEAGRVSLTRQQSPASSRLVAALVPVTGLQGRLLLRWGSYQAGTDFAITASQRTAEQAARAAERAIQTAQGGQEAAGRTAPTPAAGGSPRLTNRAHDADNSVAGRARILAQRGESAVVLPDSRRLSVTFPRAFARGQRPTATEPARDGQPAATAAASPRGREMTVDGPDFARLLSTADGAVVTLTQGSVPRLLIDAPLAFGTTVVPKGNQVEGVAGAYGLWLRRAGGGWRLVFNDEPDVWGTQHDPKADRAEITLQQTEGHDATRPFGVVLMPSVADQGQLIIIWGPYEWAADFVIGS